MFDINSFDYYWRRLYAKAGNCYCASTVSKTYPESGSRSFRKRFQNVHFEKAERSGTVYGSVAFSFRPTRFRIAHYTDKSVRKTRRKRKVTTDGRFTKFRTIIEPQKYISPETHAVLQ